MKHGAFMRYRMSEWLIIISGVVFLCSCSGTLKKQYYLYDEEGFTPVHKDSVCLSEEEIQQEIKFTTAEKTASLLGGVYVGFPAGGMLGVLAAGTVFKFKCDDSSMNLIQFFFAGAAIGTVAGPWLFYRINKNTARDQAIERLLKQRQLKQKKVEISEDRHGK